MKQSAVRKPKQPPIPAHLVIGTADDVVYQTFLCDLNAGFRMLLGDGRPLFSTNAGRPLFTTNVDNLFDTYLAALPASERQHHTCNACRRFIERFGGLVVMEPDGSTRSAIWNVMDAPGMYGPAIAAMKAEVEGSQVTGVFLSSESVWGTPITGPWQHLSITPPSGMVFRNARQSAEQAMAEKFQDFNNVIRALAEFNAEHVMAARDFLASEALYRSEKVLGPVQWLHDLYAARALAKTAERKRNVTWLAIATAPAGYAHPRSSMAGTLLEDLQSNMAMNTVAERFKAKMDPLHYQRPQAAPKAGNVEQAEKIVAKLGIENALKRRYARLDEVPMFWRPTAAPAAGSVFGHLKPAGNPTPSMPLTNVVMTWEKFARTLLPGATEIELEVPRSGSFGAILTAEDPDAPPILQWDHPERRNPCSWYCFPQGSEPHHWNLTAASLVKVLGITLQPSNWHETLPQFGESVFLLLDGARAKHPSSLCLFPEILRSDLRDVRSTLEAYSNSREATGADLGDACGYIVRGTAINIRLYVTQASGARTIVTIDRWD